MSDVVDGARSRQGIAVGGSVESYGGRPPHANYQDRFGYRHERFPVHGINSIEKVVDPIFPIYSYKVHEEFYLYGSVVKTAADAMERLIWQFGGV
jgi:hypothetical protein